MPYVNIKVTDEGVTKEQKAALIAGVTKLLQDVLNKNPATTVVVIDEVNTDNWGIRGEQVTELRKKAERPLTPMKKPAINALLWAGDARQVSASGRAPRIPACPRGHGRWRGFSRSGSSARGAPR